MGSVFIAEECASKDSALVGGQEPGTTRGVSDALPEIKTSEVETTRPDAL